MKTTKRILLGLFGTIALTSFILFALDACLMNEAAPYTSAQTNARLAVPVNLTDETTVRTKDEQLSIGTSERHMLYQSQESDQEQQQSQTAENAAADKAQDTAPSDKVHSSQKEADDKKSGKKKDTKNGQADDKSRSTFQTVSEEYFSDALFIGDSRTVGMLQSHLLPQASYYAKTGIGIGSILSARIVNEGGWMTSIRDALSRHSYGKVYIMIGINDISNGDVDWFTEQYQDILNTVRQTQPNAVIYIQGNIPMSYGTQDLDGALNNQNLSQRNEASRALADEETIFYLDIDKIYADENGHLKSTFTSDGLHVKSDYYPLWVDYLLHHAIVR